MRGDFLAFNGLLISKMNSVVISYHNSEEIIVELFSKIEAARG
jgi:hypothetical protein